MPQAVSLREQVLEEKEAVLSDKDALLEDKDRLLAERDNSLAEKEEELQRKDAELAEAANALQAEQGDDLKEKLASLEEQLQQSQQEVADLRAKAAEGVPEDVVLSVEADKEQFARLLEEMPSILEGRRKQIQSSEQRGIVVTGGQRNQLANAFVNLYLLRHHLRCTLPVAMMYFGGTETIHTATQEFFKEHVSDITFVDFSKIPYPSHQRYVFKMRGGARVGEWGDGYKLKVLAIYSAPFQEVIFLDCDTTPLVDPASLLEIPEYVEHGNIFFPDRWSDPNGPEKERLFPFYQYLGLHNPWAGQQETYPPLADSGQLYINRYTHADVLEWLLWINTHNELTYRVAWGDKDTFRAAFDLAGKREAFYQSPHRMVNALFDNSNGEGIQLAWRGFTLLAPNGSVAFVHRSWFTKYEEGSDDTRAFTHLTVELSEARSQANYGMGELTEALAHVVPLEECHVDPWNFSASVEQCGFDWRDKDVPWPVFPIPNSSYVASSGRAADEAFRKLRSAMSANPGILP